METEKAALKTGVAAIVAKLREFADALYKFPTKLADSPQDVYDAETLRRAAVLIEAQSRCVEAMRAIADKMRKADVLDPLQATRWPGPEIRELVRSGLSSLDSAS